MKRRNEQRKRIREKRRDFRQWRAIARWCAARGVKPSWLEAAKFLYRDDGLAYSRRLDMLVRLPLSPYKGSRFLAMMRKDTGHEAMAANLIPNQ